MHLILDPLVIVNFALVVAYLHIGDKLYRLRRMEEKRSEQKMPKTRERLRLWRWEKNPINIHRD